KSRNSLVRHLLPHGQASNIGLQTSATGGMMAAAAEAERLGGQSRPNYGTFEECIRGCSVSDITIARERPDLFSDNASAC
ncbi:MAG TPA: hypothetical protein VK137_03630, partial [Planctomycetaceae bacterium]|nr:hypothetical protein [Planctomycetaceae bacterium]